MARITQIRGALLEEAVLFLLCKVGYEVYDPLALLPFQMEYLRPCHSGLEVRGRGTWHQLDAFALWKHSPAFMYPLHLMIEAKCYASHRPVGVEVPRNSVGVLKDISENYFTYTRRGETFRGPRYNYSAAIFSTSGFTSRAVEYAVAHQVFLIQYENVPAIQPLIDAILRFNESCINTNEQQTLTAIRNYYRSLLNAAEPENIPGQLSENGERLLRGSLREAAWSIRGSYFGMLQGQWPLHLLRREPLPPAAFTTDVVRCRVHGSNYGEWKFVPVQFEQGDAAWFELEFSLPPLIVELVENNWDDPVAVANLKQQHFSYIDLSGVIDGIRRNVRLELDREWIELYLRSRGQ